MKFNIHSAVIKDEAKAIFILANAKINDCGIDTFLAVVAIHMYTHHSEEERASMDVDGILQKLLEETDEI